MNNEIWAEVIKLGGMEYLSKQTKTSIDRLLDISVSDTNVFNMMLLGVYEKSKLPTLVVSFSGGKTSAYMSKWLIDNKSHEFNLKFVFANTGLEHEETLKFVDKCDRHFNLSLEWIEASVIHIKGVGTEFKTVDFETASRKGEPFEEVIKKYGLPNNTFPHCNRELKVTPITKWRKKRGFEGSCAIGIRVDEIDRMSANADKMNLVYPLIGMHPTTKTDVNEWWSQQPFNLDIPEHLGNCVTCWKKSDRKLFTIAKNNPEYFNFFSKMERYHTQTGAGDGDRQMFRKHRTTDDIIASSLDDFNEFHDENFEMSNGCSDSCEAFASE